MDLNLLGHVEDGDLQPAAVDPLFLSQQVLGPQQTIDGHLFMDDRSVGPEGYRDMGRLFGPKVGRHRENKENKGTYKKEWASSTHHPRPLTRADSLLSGAPLRVPLTGTKGLDAQGNLGLTDLADLTFTYLGRGGQLLLTLRAFDYMGHGLCFPLCLLNILHKHASYFFLTLSFSYRFVKYCSALRTSLK